MKIKPNKLKYKDTYTEIYYLKDNTCIVFVTSTKRGYSIYKFDRYSDSYSDKSVFQITLDNEAPVKDNYELAKKKARELFPDMSRKHKD